LRSFAVVRVGDAGAQHEERLADPGEHSTEDPRDGIGLDSGAHR
jgi:hypothetical protein